MKYIRTVDLEINGDEWDETKHDKLNYSNFFIYESKW